MLSEKDRVAIEERGSKVDAVLSQLEHFEKGFPYLILKNAAGIGNGILHLSPDEETAALKRWDRFVRNGGTVTKFVPASGAASRMFKSLFAFIDGEDDIPRNGSDIEELIENIHDLAFYPSLNIKALEKYGENIDTLISQHRYKDIIAAIIDQNGLNYGKLPKGLIDFHRYEDSLPRTPLEEQLVEGVEVIGGNDNVIRLHFTVSGVHRNLFEEKLKSVIPLFEKKYNVRFEIELSEQKAETDTVAVNEDNSLFRDNGELLFRPAGHGALISNLNDVNSDVIFIKNIDNVVPDKRRAMTVRYKKILGGILLEVHDHIADFLESLHNNNIPDSKLLEIKSFVENDLRISPVPENKTEMIEFLKNKLRRPIRVCGMVRNEGEPGGGPFIVTDSTGTTSLQILESSQIDMDNKDYCAMLSRATHFNPVDIVCYVKDENGKKYNLKEFVDPNTGFISNKSYKGKTLKALELPGLWNGSMSNWNTIFVEVPSETFNPVKTVNDLLRPEHK